MAGVVERQVYRALLHRARYFDHKQLWAKCLLHGEPTKYYDRVHSRWETTKAESDTARSIFHEGLMQFTQGTFYRPRVSLEAVIRKAFRHQPHGGSFHGLPVVDSHRLDAAKLDAAFMALSLLEQGQAGAAHHLKQQQADGSPTTSTTPTQDGEEAVATAGLSEAPLATGSMLLAHPLLLQEGLTRSCIVLVRHSEEHGALGLVINCRLGQRVINYYHIWTQFLK